MAKKNFDTSTLLAGLTGDSQDNPSSSGVRRGRKPMGAEEKRISTIVKCDKYDKIETIAHIENIPIKDFIDKCFDLGIEAYEKKHGVVKVKKNHKKGDINDIF